MSRNNSYLKVGDDKYIYYHCLSDIIYGKANRSVPSHVWHILDSKASEEQKKQAYEEMSRWN
jgi:hypothetical protein